MRLCVLMAALALGAAACSTAPDEQSQYVARLCYTKHDQIPWTQIAPPENAAAYRGAWIAPNGSRSAYEPPRWPAHEFWFSAPTGETRLCKGNPFYREERCSAGWTVDYRETSDGPVATSANEPICIT